MNTHLYVESRMLSPRYHFKIKNLVICMGDWIPLTDIINKLVGSKNWLIRYTKKKNHHRIGFESY